VGSGEKEKSTIPTAVGEIELGVGRKKLEGTNSKGVPKKETWTQIAQNLSTHQATGEQGRDVFGPQQ